MHIALLLSEATVNAERYQTRGTEALCALSIPLYEEALVTSQHLVTTDTMPFPHDKLLPVSHSFL